MTAKPRLTNLGVLIVLTLAMMPARARADCPFEVVGQWGGSSLAVLAQNDVAYLGIGRKLVILGVGDPTHPTHLGEVQLPYQPYQFAIAGTCVYAADGFGGLQVVDVSAPADPRIVWARTNEWVKAVTVRGTTAYVYGADFRIYDVSVPLSPQLLGSCPGMGDLYSFFHYDIAVDGSFAYVAGELSGLHLFDISNALAPRYRGNVGATGDPYGVWAGDGLLYVAVDDPQELRIYDVQGSYPTFIGSTELYATLPRAVRVVDGIAYVANGAGVELLDVSIPSAPHFLNATDTWRWGRGVAVIGSQALVANYFGGMDTVNIGVPTDLQIAAEYRTHTGIVSCMAVEDDRVYVGIDESFSGGDASIVVLDVAAPEQPAVVAVYPCGYAPVGMHANNHTVYGFRVSSSLMESIDFSDPAHPVRELWPVPLMAPRDLAFGSGYTYLVGDGIALDELTLWIPAHAGDPYVLGGCSLAQGGRAAALAGEFLFVAGDLGLSVVEAGDPHRPLEAAFVAADTPLRDIAISNGLAFVTGRGLTAFDVSDPVHPRAVADRRNYYWNSSVVASGTTVFVLDYHDGFVDAVSTNHLPELGTVAQLRTSDWPQGMAVRDNLLFIADAEGGLLVARFGHAADLDLDLNVDVRDLTVLLGHFGASGNVRRQDGDITGDGRVDVADLLALLRVFGTTCE